MNDTSTLIHTCRDMPKITKWCDDNGVIAHWIGMLFVDDETKHAWEVPDEKQRLMFIMKWGE